MPGLPIRERNTRISVTATNSLTGVKWEYKCKKDSIYHQYQLQSLWTTTYRSKSSDSLDLLFIIDFSQRWSVNIRDRPAKIHQLFPFLPFEVKSHTHVSTDVFLGFDFEHWIYRPTRTVGMNSIEKEVCGLRWIEPCQFCEFVKLGLGCRECYTGSGRCTDDNCWYSRLSWVMLAGLDCVCMQEYDGFG